MNETERLNSIRTLADNYYQATEEPAPLEKEPVDTMQIRFGGAVKATGNSIEFLLIPNGSPTDLDTDNEFFTAKTDLGIRIPGAVKLHYNHGMTESVGKVPLAWAELERREDGVWVKADLGPDAEVDGWLDGEREKAQKYRKLTLQLAREGLLGGSSGAAGHMVMRAPAGKGHELLRWPVAEASVTPTPASPRTFGTASVKSLAALPDPEALLEAFKSGSGRRSLAESTEQVLDDLDGLLTAYQTISGQEVKIGRALSASRRARLEQAAQLISDLLGETAVREDPPAEPDTPPAEMDEGAGGAEAPTKTDAPSGAQLQAEVLRLRARAALVQTGVTL